MNNKYKVNETPRERIYQIEKHLTIEKSDLQFVCRTPEENCNKIKEEDISLKKMKKNNKVIHEKNKSKTSPRKTKRINSASDKSTVESIQEKL